MTTLADRIRSAEIEVERLDLDAIASAVASAAERTTSAALPDLVRLAHRESPRSGDFNTSFRAPFREADPTLLLDGEDELGAALACAVLSGRFELESSSPLTHAAAVFVESAAFLGWQPKVPDLLQDARSHLQSTGDEVRERRPPPDIGLSFKGFDETVKAVEDACGNNAASQMHEELPAVLKALRDAARNLRHGANKALEAVNRNQERTDEELDIYWWVSSGFSHLLRQPLAKAPKAAVSLVAGVELADLVTFIPGPPAADGFLSTALRAAKVRTGGVQLAEAVNHLPATIPLELPAPLTSHPEFSPIAFAVTRHLEAGDKSWTSPFSKQTGLDPATEFQPLALSLQAYNECLLHSILGEEDE